MSPWLGRSRENGTTIKNARVRVGALGSRPQPLKVIEDALGNTPSPGHAQLSKKCYPVRWMSLK